MTTAPTTQTSDAPDVSVIMPAWCAAGFINASITSVLASQGVSLELIIVDDASPDHTFETLQRRAAEDARIRIDRLETNGGPSAARNRALEMAKGRYVAIVDADDLLAASRLRKLVALADASDAGIVVDNMIEVDAGGERLSNQPFLKSAAFSSPRDITLKDYIRYNQPMKSGDCLGYLKPLFRRETLVELDARYDERLRNSEDYYLVAHLLARGVRMTYTPYTGYFYQRADGSTSHRLRPAHTAAWLEAETEFHAAYLQDLAPDAARQLNARARALRDVDQFVRAIDAIKQRRFGELMRMLASDLHATAFTMGWFAKIAWERLGRFGRAQFRTQSASL